MRRTRLLGITASLTAALVLSACGSSGEESGEGGSGGDASGDQFPVTVEHAFGETTIEEKPERIATVAWANHEVPLALGVVPVGMSKATWGDDDGDGVLPWVEEKLEELDAETPVLFDETEGFDFEAVADTQPDVILAAYSGLTQEDYDTLSQIAPTVAFPDVAWSTSWQQMVELNAQAMGMSAEGEELVADLEQQVSDAFAAEPSLEGTSMAFTSTDPTDLSQIGFYSELDPRPAFLVEAGMTESPAVTEASEGSEEFYLTLSAEEADRFEDTDMFVTYGTDELLGQLQDDPLMSQIPAIERGAVAVLPDSTPLAAAANPSPLSIPWGLEEYVGFLAEAAQKSS
ncbi:iron-siderophore ABC transporter substrate-binding protein [Nocardioides aequoreus]|uniref:iron-siderophore ABC transporter substrate-binding protein n=1 Tax=Nocardioides aequoreus TaxID=397278 RepID=UPI0004C3CECE|nr:iron-siderophore ABC transporter substrate-binding protein [Nocardioides aequoreus]